MDVATKAAIADYLIALENAGAATADVVIPGDTAAIESLNQLIDVTLPESLATYLSIVGDYDQKKCSELDIFEPHFAWGMFAVPVKYIKSQYDIGAGCGGDENPDYWPFGFVPILSEGSGSYLIVNCLASSKTYGAVYDMSEGVGCNRIAASLAEFFQAASQELNEGVVIFSSPDFSEYVHRKNYLADAKRYYGETPYFTRKGRMDEQIVDWK